MTIEELWPPPPRAFKLTKVIFKYSIGTKFLQNTQKLVPLENLVELSLQSMAKKKFVDDRTIRTKVMSINKKV